MKRIKSFEIFLEEMTNPNTPQGYLNSLSKKPKLKPNQNGQKPKPTDEVDDILINTEEQKQRIVAKKDTIEKGLLNNIKDLEPENQKDVQTQVKDYKNQVTEFDKTVKQINQLSKTLKKSNVSPTESKNVMDRARKNIR
jgi:hypothetical protein